MALKFTKIFLCIFFLCLFEACTENFDSVAIISVPANSSDLTLKLNSFSSLLEAGGLTTTEAQAIKDSISTEYGASVSRLNVSSQSLTVAALPVFIEGAMKALGTSAFSSVSRKKEAIKLITSKLLEVFSSELSSLTAEQLEDIVTATVEAQFKNNSHAGLTGADQEEALKDIINEAIKSCDSICASAEKKTGFVRSLASSATKFLANTGMSSSSIEAVIPKIVNAAVTAVSNLGGS